MLALLAPFGTRTTDKGTNHQFFAASQFGFAVCAEFWCDPGIVQASICLSHTARRDRMGIVPLCHSLPRWATVS